MNAPEARILTRRLGFIITNIGSHFSTKTALGHEKKNKANFK